MAGSVALYECVFILGLTVLVSSHENVNPLNAEQVPHHHQQQQFHQEQHAEQTHHGMDRNDVHNQEHIMEHLEGKITKPVETMTEEELQFHYFKVHDYDDNNLLDGVELITALTDHHVANTQDKAENINRMSDQELQTTIDDILKDNDIDGDGYINYAEFARAQRLAKEDKPSE